MARVIAWLGGGLFVASLGYTLFFYTLILGEASPPDGASLPLAASVNGALFGLFALHHSLFAREGVKRLLTRVIPARMERSSYVWIASLLWLVVCLSWQRVDGLMYEVSGLARWALYGLQLAGVHLVLRSASVIDPLELAGIHQARQRNASVALRSDGPFGLVRHPIYLGWILMVCAAPTMTANRLMFAAISTLYLIVAIPWEERSLVAAFGDRYRAYQSAVRWRLIPGVW